MKTTALLAAVTLAILASAQAQTAPDLSKAEAQIQQWLEAGDYPAAGLWLVSEDGKTLYERYWNEYTRDTVITIASASKWLEAATAMTLVDAGKLDLDKPISTYLPEMTGPQGHNTIRQMLSHTSTLNHITIDDRQGIDHFPALLAAGHTDVKPGAVFLYGGTALATLSRAIEVVTGKPWLTVFAENIARPCHMTRTITGANLWTYDKIVGGDNFPCSNAQDYMNFLQMLLHDGVFNGQRVLSSAAMHEMQTDQVRSADLKRPAYPEEALEEKQHGVYGFGEWRLVLNPQGEAVILSSPAYTGFFPWLDKKHHVTAVFVARTVWGAKINAFVTVPILARLVSDALDRQEKTVSSSPK